MDNMKEFEEYKKFCNETKIKECEVDSLNKFFEYKDNLKKASSENKKACMVICLSCFDKVSIIEDFLIWCYENEFDANMLSSLILYKDKVLNK